MAVRLFPLPLSSIAAATLAVTLALSPQPPAGAAESLDPGTRRMAQLLAERAAAVNIVSLWFLINDKRAEMMEGLLRQPPAGIDMWLLRRNYAAELLFAGRYLDAISRTTELLDEVGNGPENAARRRDLQLLLATTFMRLGEEQNCAEGNNADSCLLPIKGGGVHRRQEGSLQAIKVLEKVLEEDPDNLQARWLINIAHMTVGTYPDGVSPRALIPPSAFESEYPLPSFRNVAMNVGLDIFGLSGGAAVADFDGDGLLDLMTSAIGFDDPIRVFRNDGRGRFEEKTATAGLEGITGGLNLVHADYDNDGLVDVVVLRGAWMNEDGNFPFSLLRNLGNFRFADVTEQAGLLRFAPSQTAVWFDYNNDGWLDLFVGNESLPTNVKPCQLYHNNGDGTFTEIAERVGADVKGYVKGVVSGDFDNDGRPDLFLSIAEANNILLRNDGPAPGDLWRFTVSEKAGIQEPGQSFPAAVFDFDNDGWLDIFVAAYKSGAEDAAADYLGLPTPVHRARLYRNQGDGTFRDVTREMGLDVVMPVMGLNYGDLDNDGWIDIYTGTGNPEFSTLVPNRMFRNDEGRRFQDVTTAGNFGHLQKGHAISFADFDNDGDQDVFAVMGGAYQADRAYGVLYENPGSKNRWVSVELKGTQSNESAIGARLKLVVRRADGSTREIHRAVSSGASFGTRPFRQEIGLGDAAAIERLEVYWPVTGETQVFRNLAPNRRYKVREGEKKIAEVRAPVVAFARTPPPAGGHRHHE